MAFTEAEYTDLLTWGGTTATTVLDSDGVLKMALHNLIPNTDLTDTGYWTHTGLDSVAESGTSPSGKVAYLLTEDTSTGPHRVYTSPTFSSGGYYKAVIDAKANGRNIGLRLNGSGFTTNVEWTFDLSAVSVSQVLGGTKDAAFISSLGNGWYRCVLYAEATSSSSASVQPVLMNGSSSSYAGDGSSGVYLSRPRVYQSAVHAPVELVTNGDFATDSDWTKGTGWTIGSGVASCDGTQVGNTLLDQTISTVSGNVYRVEFTISSYSAGNIFSQLSTGAAVGDTRTADGTYVDIITADGSIIYLKASIDFTGNIDNVSVVEIKDDGMQLGSDGTDYLDTGDAGPLYTPGVAYDDNGACLGLQSFEARTNSVRVNGNFQDNSAALGVVSGSGNLPTGWFLAGIATSATEVTGFGEEAGASYIDIRFNGTPTSNFTLYLESGSQIAASDGQNWSASARAKLASGSLTNLTGVTFGNIRRATGSWHSSGQGSITLDSELTRFEYVDTSVDDSDGAGTITHIHPMFTFSWTSGAVDLTIRIVMPQMEQGAFVGPSIPTNGAAVARGAHNTYKAISEFGYNQSEGSVVIVWQSLDDSTPVSFELGDGTTANYIRHYNDGGNIRYRINNGGSGQVNAVGASGFTTETEYGYAAAYKVNDFAVSVDGATVSADTSGSVPTVDTLYLGNRTGSSQHLNGFIKKLVYYPSRLSDSTLESESS